MNKWIVFKGINGFYKVEGTGATLMLVHGFIEDGGMWNEIVKALRKHYCVIVPDLPGFGESPLKDNTPTALSMEFYAEYIHEILKQEKIKKAIILGHSMGGYVALSFAEKYGQMLSGFGLINSHCYADSDEKKINRKKGIEFIRRNGTEVFVETLYHSIFSEKFIAKNRKLVNSLIAKAMKYEPAAVMLANEAMMNRKDKSEILKKAKVPVLFINGKQDESAPLQHTLKQALLPDIADVHFFDGCKHMSVFEKKKETIGAIRAFCERVT